MQYSYNRLWKMLIDRNMTKTEMRKQAGISTNILAKMGRNLIQSLPDDLQHAQTKENQRDVFFL